MKVLFVTGIFPPDIGGPATYVPLMANALSRRGHEVSVVCLSDGPGTGVADSFPVERVPRRLPLSVRFALTTRRIFASARDVDVIFANGLYAETVTANLLLRKPLIFKVVGDWAWERATNRRWTRADFQSFDQIRGSIRVRVVRGLRSACLRRADAVIVPSRFLAGAAVGWGARADRIAVIYNAAHVPKQLSAVDVPLATPFKFVTVCRLLDWKRIDRLLGALAHVAGAGLVIIGDGSERERLQKQAASLGIERRVLFCGSRSREDALALMSQCDVLVLNSSYEGFPHVLLEGMSLGLPVIATAVGGIGELVRDGENGRLVPPLDDARLLDAMRDLATSPAERERLANGATLTLKRFGFDRMITETESILAGTVERRVAAELVMKA